MQSTAKTVNEYLNELPEERKAAFLKLRESILKSIPKGFEEEMRKHCISSIPELFDGNPPFKGRGAVSFAMNVALILHVLKQLNKYY